MVRRLHSCAAAVVAGTALAVGVAVAVEGAMRREELVVVEDHREPMVSIRIEVPVGEWSPWARSHHLADVWLTQARDPAGRFVRRADDLGVELSLSVRPRSAVLATTCRREDLEAVLDLVRQVLTHPDLDRRDLRRRRQARRLEWETLLRDPWFRLHQQVARLLFAEGDARRWASEEPPRASTDVGELAATRALALALPGRVVGLAGDVSREEAEKAVSGLLPPLAEVLPAGLEPALGPMRPESARPAVAEARMRRLTQIYLVLAAPALGVGDPDFPALLLADHVLGGHFYSRLSVALRHEAGDTYAAGTTLPRDRDAGAYTLYTFTNTANAAAAEARLGKVLAVFHRDGLSESERAAAAGFLVGQLAFARQAPGRVLARRLWERRIGLPEDGWEALVRGAAELPLDRVNAFAARFFDPARFSLVRVQPNE